MGRRTTNLPPYVRRHRDSFRAVFLAEGKLHRSPTFKTPREASAYAKAVLRLAREGAAQLPTLGRAWDRLDDELTAIGARAGTRAYYRKQREIVGRSLPDSMLLHEIDEDRLRAYAAARIAAGVLPRTAWHHELGALGRALNVAVRGGLIQRNPLALIRKPPNRQKGFKMLAMDAIDEALAKIRASGLPNAARDADIVELSFACSLRLSELARLRRQDVDLKAGRVFVEGKTGDQHVPIGARARPVLERILASGRDPLFPSAKTIGTMTLRWSRRLGLAKNFSTQVLRHSAATAVVRAGVNPWVVMEFMRHADLRTTRKYVHEAPDQVRTALDALRPSPPREAPPAE